MMRIGLSIDPPTVFENGDAVPLNIGLNDETEGTQVTANLEAKEDGTNRCHPT